MDNKCKSADVWYLMCELGFGNIPPIRLCGQSDKLTITSEIYSISS